MQSAECTVLNVEGGNRAHHGGTTVWSALAERSGGGALTFGAQQAGLKRSPPRAFGVTFNLSRGLVFGGLMFPGLLFGAGAEEGPEKIPPLQPPRGEIPPGFWELYGVWVVVGSVVFLALCAALVWYLTRPKSVVPVPPGAQARQALERLRQQPEDGVVLSRVSQVVRRYAAQAFGLPPGELTTSEFCQALAGQQRVGPDLAGALAEFLRQCDERKFAPAVPGPALGAVARALELIETSEARVAPAGP
jgi:uncharacterized protein DUF4381